MKKMLLCLLAISLLLTGCGKNKPDSAAAEGEGKAKFFVKTAAVQTADFSKILSLPGNLEAMEQAFISAKVSGTVQRIHADIGSKVAKGQILCKIDDVVYSLQHQKAQTNLSAQQIRFDDAARSYERMKALYEKQAISQADFENIESQFKMAKETLNNAQYDFNLASESLKETNIISPFAGTVSMKDVSAGENVSPGKSLFAVVNTNKMFVEAGVAEQDIVRVKEGQRVSIKISSLANKTFEGLVTHVGPVPTQSTKNYPVKITVDNPDNLLKAGMFATVEILLDERKGSKAVPKESIVTEDGKRYIYVEREGKVEKKLVEIGYDNEKLVEIISGLELNEKVVTSGQENLTEGALVEVK